MTCELGKTDPDTQCTHDEHLCVTEGVPLHWGSSCLSYAVQKDGSAKDNLSAEQTRALVDQAFALWANASCPGGGNPSFVAQFQGFVSCDQQEAVCNSPNVNVVMYHDTGWPHSTSDIAVTTPSAGLSTGLIIDADLELNSQDYTFSTNMTAGDRELLPVLAHELGHFLGLAHSDATGALMSRTYSMLMLSSNPLTADDAAAICTVYPPNQSLACGPAGMPAYDACQVDPNAPQECHIGSISNDATGCGCRVAPRSSSYGWVSAALGLLVLGGSRRRSRASRPA